jgi:hypothetical protein
MSKPTVEVVSAVEVVSTVEVVSMVEVRPRASMTGLCGPMRLAMESSAVRVLTAR